LTLGNGRGEFHRAGERKSMQTGKARVLVIPGLGGRDRKTTGGATVLGAHNRLGGWKWHRKNKKERVFGGKPLEGRCG